MFLGSVLQLVMIALPAFLQMDAKMLTVPLVGLAVQVALMTLVKVLESHSTQKVLPGGGEGEGDGTGVGLGLGDGGAGDGELAGPGEGRGAGDIGGM